MVRADERFHPAQIRAHFGFRECSVEDAEKLTAWLAAAVCEVERDHARVLHRAEMALTCQIVGRIVGRIPAVSARYTVIPRGEKVV